ncbi:macrophage mannose receptor 1-like isoform 4-T4 [Menidia menidia]
MVKMLWSVGLLTLLGLSPCFACKFYQYKFVKEKKNWTEAREYCRQNYTDLATVMNKEDVERLKKLNLPKEESWIGLYNHTGDKWLWSLPGVEFDNSTNMWDDKEPNGGAIEVCGTLTKHKQWNDVGCCWKQPFICYDDKVVLIRKKMNWENALYYCREHHQDLVTIRNFDEQQWVQEKAKKATTPFVWMGLHHTCTLGFWFWVGGEFVSYNNWNQTAVRDECNMSAAMEASGQHKWLKKNDDEEFNFICSKY